MRRRLTPIADLATHPQKYVQVKPLARYLDCDPRTITRMIIEDVLPAVKVGSEWRIPTEEARRMFIVERH